ncbi:hypothetical protein G7085_14785 [Tessaracoccus sp. HDW20]|nr:hypothetical protein [Tessaracoccus coleopterorum]NHB85455.1 hypothetical protein [Tessaracoccus coleopterorum]
MQIQGIFMQKLQRLTIGELTLPDHVPVSLGNRHPTSTGIITIDISSDDTGAISTADVTTGFGHRGAEKLFEVRDYRSMIMLADRHDWLAAASGELSLTLTVENAMRLTPTPRAVVLRTLLAELARIHSHLAFLSYLADDRIAAALWEVVDSIRRQMLGWAGNRVHPMLNRVGGLAADAPEGWLEAMDDLLDDAARVAADLRASSPAPGASQGSPCSTARCASRTACQARSRGRRAWISTAGQPDTSPTARPSARWTAGPQATRRPGSPS